MVQQHGPLLILELKRSLVQYSTAFPKGIIVVCCSGIYRNQCNAPVCIGFKSVSGIVFRIGINLEVHTAIYIGINVVPMLIFKLLIRVVCTYLVWYCVLHRNQWELVWFRDIYRNQCGALFIHQVDTRTTGWELECTRCLVLALCFVQELVWHGG